MSRRDLTHAPPYSPLSILVVDDYPDAAETQAELLGLMGHVTRVAFGGADALRCAELERFDVVLLDLRMPGTDGFAVARAIRARCAGAGPQPLIVAVTGCGTEKDRLRSAEAGFDLHLVKPVDPAVLAGVLEGFRRVPAPPAPAVEISDSLGDLMYRRGRVPAWV